VLFPSQSCSAACDPFIPHASTPFTSFHNRVDIRPVHPLAKLTQPPSSRRRLHPPAPPLNPYVRPSPITPTSTGSSTAKRWPDFFLTIRAPDLLHHNPSASRGGSRSSSCSPQQPACQSRARERIAHQNLFRANPRSFQSAAPHP